MKFGSRSTSEIWVRNITNLFRTRTITALMHVSWFPLIIMYGLIYAAISEINFVYRNFVLFFCYRSRACIFRSRRNAYTCTFLFFTRSAIGNRKVFLSLKKTYLIVTITLICFYMPTPCNHDIQSRSFVRILSRRVMNTIIFLPHVYVILGSHKHVWKYNFSLIKSYERAVDDG